MLLKVLSANDATSTSAEKISGQTNKQTNKQTDKQTNKQTNKQDKNNIVTGTGDYKKTVYNFH